MIESDSKLVSTIADLAIRSAEVKRLVETPEKLIFLDAADNLRTIDIPIGPLKVGLDQPSDLAEFAVDHATESSAICISSNRIKFWSDENDRRIEGDCILSRSKAFEWISTFGGKELDQAGIVRALRVPLGDVAEGRELLSVLRSIRFDANGNVAGRIDHGKESFSRETRAAVGDEVRIPETVVLRMPVYAEFPALVEIPIAVEVFPSTQMFALTVVGNGLTRAVRVTLEKIRDQITELVAASPITRVYITKNDR
jgi:hypothetical protein